MFNSKLLAISDFINYSACLSNCEGSPNMPKLTYRIENAPGKVYGKNSNELVFKEPSSGALVYSTATASGLLKSTKKQLFRGPPSDKEGGVCVATLDEPSGNSGDETLEMHHHKLDGCMAEPASTRLRLKKTSSWVPLSGNNLHAVAFRGAGYTWTDKSALKRDGDGRAVARVTGPWFWQGKLGDMAVDIPEMGDEDERRALLEMVLGTFVLRWWGDRAAEEERKRELKRKSEEAAQVKAAQKKAAAKGKEEEKQRQEEERDEDNAEGGEQQAEDL